MLVCSKILLRQQIDICKGKLVAPSELFDPPADRYLFDLALHTNTQLSHRITSSLKQSGKDTIKS